MPQPFFTTMRPGAMGAAARLSKSNRSHRALVQIVLERANGNPRGGARRFWMYQAWLAEAGRVAEDVLGVQTFGLELPASELSGTWARFVAREPLQRHNLVAL